MGLNAFGVDLSPQMVAIARQTHPGIRFDEGSMTALDLPDASLGGIVALYSIIHLPGGSLLIAFQVGDEQRHRTEVFGHTISLDYYRRQPGFVADLLTQSGFRMRAQMLGEPDGDVETLPRAYLLADKPVDVK